MAVLKALWSFGNGDFEAHEQQSVYENAGYLPDTTCPVLKNHRRQGSPTGRHLSYISWQNHPTAPSRTQISLIEPHRELPEIYPGVHTRIPEHHCLQAPCVLRH